MADIIRAEQQDGRRVLHEDEHVIAFVPYFARYAYEVYVVPKRRVAHVFDLNDAEVAALAGALSAVTIRFDNLWRMSFPYVMVLHQAPDRRRRLPRVPFLHRVPSAAAPAQLLKYLAGPEIGGGNFVSDTSPEAKAAELRAQAPAALQARMTGLRDARGAGRPHSRRARGHPRRGGRGVRAPVDRRAVGGGGRRRGRHGVRRRPRVRGGAARRASRSSRGDWPCLLVAEGLGQDGRRVLPDGTREEDVEIVVIVDPIDGTRGLMMQKRPAWVLTGVAPYRTDARRWPTSSWPCRPRSRSSNRTCATRCGRSRAAASTANASIASPATRRPLAPRPSRATTIDQGFGGVTRFFPGARAELAAIDDEVVEAVLGPTVKGRALAFEDQYISNAGQLYELPWATTAGWPSCGP